MIKPSTSEIVPIFCLLAEIVHNSCNWSMRKLYLTFAFLQLLVDMIETDKYGYYHATNAESVSGEYISWYDFTKEIYRQAGMNTAIVPVSTAEYGFSKATRPFNSRLDKSKLIDAGFAPLPDWKDALGRYLKEAKL